MLEVAVVGCGMIGSAAMKYLARAGVDVMGFSSREPASFADHNGVFASHYDAARITRTLDPNREWARMAQASVDRYVELERESGIDFFDPAGFAVFGPPGSNYVDRVRDTANELATVSRSARPGDFSGIDFGSNTDIEAQDKDAGVINPRELVRAQLILAEREGAKVRYEEVSRIEQHAGSGVSIETIEGHSFDVQRVLIAAGGFSEPALTGARLRLDVQGRVVFLVEADEDIASAMPALIADDAEGLALSEFYVLPPVLYPDGKRYLKIGTAEYDHPLRSPADKISWFWGEGDVREDIRALQQTIEALVPSIRNSATQQLRCVITYTATGYPYLDWLNDRTALAVGGCGQAAKSSDEIGRLAARLFAGDERRYPAITTN